MNHPTFPLQREEIDAVAELPRINGTINDLSKELAAIKERFNKLRDEQFPGWREKYESEFQQWRDKQ